MLWLVDPQTTDHEVLDTLKSALRDDADSLELVEAVMLLEDELGKG